MRDAKCPRDCQRGFGMGPRGIDEDGQNLQRCEGKRKEYGVACGKNPECAAYLKKIRQADIDEFRIACINDVEIGPMVKGFAASMKKIAAQCGMADSFAPRVAGFDDDDASDGPVTTPNATTLVFPGAGQAGSTSTSTGKRKEDGPGLTVILVIVICATFVLVACIGAVALVMNGKAKAAAQVSDRVSVNPLAYAGASNGAAAGRSEGFTNPAYAEAMPHSVPDLESNTSKTGYQDIPVGGTGVQSDYEA